MIDRNKICSLERDIEKLNNKLQQETQKKDMAIKVFEKMIK
jgi:hypothetical protein